ncbi:MAG: hypothetical protein SGJ19_00600 [Planctomycetia bacterium]|nr:hypothetical protein [Planctomycetia bacterium]
MATSRQHAEMDSAEWAVVIGGFSLFAIGLLSVLVVVAVNRRPAAPVIAAAPIPPAAAQPVAASPSPYAPAAPVSTSPPVQGNSTEAPASDLPDEPLDESSDNKEQPSTITLQAPWPDEPEDRPRDTGVVSGESIGARLAREAQERRQADREARDERRRKEDEERRRRMEGAQGGGQAHTPPPSHIPGQPRFPARPPQLGSHRITGPEATSPVDQEVEYVATQYTPPQENRRPFRRSRFAAAVGLLVTGLHLLYASMLNPHGLKDGRVTRHLVDAIGTPGARILCLLGGVVAVAFGALVLFLNLQMLGVV